MSVTHLGKINQKMIKKQKPKYQLTNKNKSIVISKSI